MKTGQTSCYNDSHQAVPRTSEHDGQDARENRGVAKSYTDNGNGTIKDNVTGLTWQKCAIGQMGTGCLETATEFENFSNANNQCNTLTLARKTWRLPTIEELETLLDYGSTPAINGAFFPRILQTTSSSGRYWTNTLSADNTYWYIEFNNGTHLKSGNNAVRCVTK